MNLPSLFTESVIFCSHFSSEDLEDMGNSSGRMNLYLPANADLTDASFILLHGSSNRDHNNNCKLVTDFIVYLEK